MTRASESASASCIDERFLTEARRAVQQVLACAREAEAVGAVPALDAVVRLLVFAEERPSARRVVAAYGVSGSSGRNH